MAELVGEHDGTVNVETYDWTLWLGSIFRKLDNILSYQYFKIDRHHPGAVKCYVTLDSEPTVQNLLKVDEK